MFTVYHSNQLDLLKALTTALIEREPLDNPFQQEVVLVQSPGMAQWLQMQLAQQFSIAANIVFPLPATFIWDMFTRVLPDIPKESAFSKEAMTWKLMWLLPDLLENPLFSPMKRYLSDDGDRRKIHQLAARVADLFDQYLVYRPEWLESWERGQLIEGLDDAQQWQALLWVELTRYTRQLEQPEWHRANLYQRFIHQLLKSDVCPQGLPKRVFICGISALPPIYLQALQALGKHIDIHLMFTNPCRYFWGDIQDYAFLAKLQSRKRRHYRESIELSLFRHPQQAEQLFNTDGEQNLSNPLLASWGRLGRDHMYLLSQIDEIQEVHAFVDIEPDNLLHGIQHDMLELEDHAVIGTTPETLARSDQKRRLDLDDRSLSFHVCHSPQREVEVLQDHLLGLLAADPELTPRDIIVMVVDIDSYTPYIQAAFGNAPSERYLPFAISDRKASQAHPALHAFITLLDLPQSRFTAEQVLALLEVPALATKFGITEDGLRRLRQWVGESGIRWGLDDDNVRELSLPATGQHTWRFGLTRMLLGYAMDSTAGDWQGILPYDESSGLAAELAGQLADMLMHLSQWRQQLGQPRELSEWLPICRQLLDTFFDQDNDTEAALVLIEQQWQKVIGYGIAAQYPDVVPLNLLRDELAARLDNERISQRFLAGPINFCTLMPMRSIPFKVVCLLGMNDGVYPRTLPPQGFDLMAKKVRRGDRSRRDDDRYLFLEALLSAQQQLYISYIGRSIQDNSKRYPSVLVSELIEYVAQSYHLPGDEKLSADDSAQRVTQHLLCWHARMPFSAENFIKNSELQSYAAEWLPSAESKGHAHPNFNQPLQAEPLAEITLDELVRFYRHPVRAFFQLRLGVNFVIEETELPDEEPFTLDNLSRYQFNTQLLNALINEDDINSVFARARAAGVLPYGSFGELYWESQQDEMVPLAEQIRSERKENHSIELNIEFADITVTGWIHQVQDDGLVRWRPSILTAVDGLLLWLEHLVYCSAGGEGESRIYGRKGTAWRYAPMAADEARPYLQQLIKGYQQGLCEPLMLLSKSGWAWLSQCFDRESGQILWDEETQGKARMKLLQVWQGDQRVTGEGEDHYIQRVCRRMDNQHLDIILHETERYLLPIARHNKA
ncbi:exodeoxyribonuclease V subunit gamma [Yersinia pseudotuberculosis]|uniref:exodeoxyribonuclease V subunit gamma n=1 Tax=Yersinia pseudotuberculosis TaxID=633 RepID=UPI0004F89E83|nr:exodeoxyribonuclease V subunit gamma [Yersinia pseudotuberculosis]AIN13028.1 exodeoxyribonuclease V, gamma subunit [Yersinia pseudotuberculosis]AJJ08342.1 exodeoxyribonuclease V, gamma subunit [Yersinia pseudotuberculosis]MBO1555475.1 exodeoxyribonuclease V subunit gamma [Yersinia pseudotuberculosis]MBO1561944.1 exodeoxyribonuclease V subunit gamma [Yersinia pseudotuberculosis]CNK38922.1 exonuclease V subunit gamma [Yersinia pseudotuberculosis]